MTDDRDVFAKVAADVAAHMASLLDLWPKHEPYLVDALTSSIGMLIAIAAKDPAHELQRVSDMLLKFDWYSARIGHFGYKLGVDQKPGLSLLQGGYDGTERRSGNEGDDDDPKGAA